MSGGTGKQPMIEEHGIDHNAEDDDLKTLSQDQIIKKMMNS